LQSLAGGRANPLRMDERGTARRSGVQSVGVGAALLRALADASGPEPLGVLARAAKMSPAKAHRYLVSFVEAGLVVQLERTGEYDLGPLATRLGLAAIQRFDVVRTAGERLAELRDAVDATTLLALWTDVGPTVARIVLSAHPVTLAVRIGTAFPILSTATGRVYLAFGEQNDIRRLCAANGAAERDAEAPYGSLPPSRRRTSANVAAEYDAEALRDQVRAKGLAHVSETFLVGVEALSGPLFDAEGRLAAAITIISRPGQLDLSPEGPVAARLREFVARIRGV
jgi:DNA-binding IclR family transcriptional regulator